MNLFNTVWDWLSIENNQKTLAFIGGGLVVVIAGSWQGYLYFSESHKESTPIVNVSGHGIANTGSLVATSGQGGDAVNVVGNNNNVGMGDSSVVDMVSALTAKVSPNDEYIRLLTEAVTTLSKEKGIFGTELQVKTALDILANGTTSQAIALFVKVKPKPGQETKEAAKAFRYLGTLAFTVSPTDALALYRRATELDPEDVEGWNLSVPVTWR